MDAIKSEIFDTNQIISAQQISHVARVRGGGLPSSCAGFGKTGQRLNHCLAHCSIYMGENVAGKAGMVIKAKRCVICLLPNHTADQCYDKNNQKRICGVDGCKCNHHPTLHGAKDPLVASNVTRVISGSGSSRGSGRTSAGSLNWLRL